MKVHVVLSFVILHAALHLWMYALIIFHERNLFPIMTNPTKSHHAQYESFNLFFGGYKLEFILLLNKVGIYLMKYTGIRWSIIILTSTKPKPKTSSSVC